MELLKPHSNTNIHKKQPLLVRDNPVQHHNFNNSRFYNNFSPGVTMSDLKSVQRPELHHRFSFLSPPNGKNPSLPPHENVLSPIQQNNNNKYNYSSKSRRSYSLVSDDISHSSDAGPTPCLIQSLPPPSIPTVDRQAHLNNNNYDNSKHSRDESDNYNKSNSLSLLSVFNNSVETCKNSEEENLTFPNVLSNKNSLQNDFPFYFEDEQNFIPAHLLFLQEKEQNIHPFMNTELISLEDIFPCKPSSDNSLLHPFTVPPHSVISSNSLQNTQTNISNHISTTDSSNLAPFNSSSQLHNMHSLGNSGALYSSFLLNSSPQLPRTIHTTSEDISTLSPFLNSSDSPLFPLHDTSASSPSYIPLEGEHISNNNLTIDTILRTSAQHFDLDCSSFVNSNMNQSSNQRFTLPPTSISFDTSFHSHSSSSPLLTIGNEVHVSSSVSPAVPSSHFSINSSPSLSTPSPNPLVALKNNFITTINTLVSIPGIIRKQILVKKGEKKGVNINGCVKNDKCSLSSSSSSVQSPVLPSNDILTSSPTSAFSSPKLLTSSVSGSATSSSSSSPSVPKSKAFASSLSSSSSTSIPSSIHSPSSSLFTSTSSTSSSSSIPTFQPFKPSVILSKNIVPGIRHPGIQILPPPKSKTISLNQNKTNNIVNNSVSLTVKK
jgi:hypothetical protein